MVSPYIHIFLSFILGWIYVSVLHHAKGVGNIPVIWCDCRSKRPYIVGHSVESLLQNFHGLCGPGLVTKEEENKKTPLCQEGFHAFVFFVYKQVIPFQRGHFYPSFHIPLLHFCNTWSLSVLVLVILFLNYWPFHDYILWYHLFDNI